MVNGIRGSEPAYSVSEKGFNDAVGTHMHTTE
jgi:hypothetical protein